MEPTSAKLDLIRSDCRCSLYYKLGSRMQKVSIKCGVKEDRLLGAQQGKKKEVQDGPKEV
jgi:hypothetical protein